MFKRISRLAQMWSALPRYNPSLSSGIAARRAEEDAFAGQPCATPARHKTRTEGGTAC